MKKILWGLVVITGVYFFWGEFEKEKDKIPLKVHFLDVGQGDSILIDYLGEYQILIDAGPSGEKLLKALGEKMPWWDKKIEIALLTHPDQDHLGGFLDLLDNFQVDLFLTNGQKSDSQNFLTLQEKIDQKKIKEEAVSAGSNWQIGNLLKFLVLNPEQNNSQNGGEKNDQSVVIQMDFGQNSFLFTGDAEKTTERNLLLEGKIEDIDWLKVAHHGSKNSTTEEFLEVARPEKAVISVGKNSYGHPTQETLERLKKNNVEIFRTDELGTVSVFCFNLREKCQKVD